MLKNTLRQHSLIYLSGFLLLFGIKYFYSKAGSDELIWILAPTTGWVSILSGIPFEYEPGIGYVNHWLRYIIAPSCSGVQFLMIVMAMLLFSFAHRFQNSKIWLGISVICSYLLTIFVNGLRIIIAMYLPQVLNRYGFVHSLLTPDRLHTIIGTAVYFVSLLIIYHLADSLTGKHNKKRNRLMQFLLPLFWYFFIVLILPLLNGALLKGPTEYLEYSALIIPVCAAILFALYLITLIWSRARAESP